MSPCETVSEIWPLSRVYVTACDCDLEKSFNFSSWNCQSHIFIRFICKHIVNSTCNISQSVGVWKFSNIKSDLQGHSKSVGLVSFNWLQLISCGFFTVSIFLSCTVPEIISGMSWISIEKKSCDPETPHSGVIYHVCPSTHHDQPFYYIW